MDRAPSKQLPTEILPQTGWPRISLLITLSLLTVIFINLLVISYLDRYSANYGYWIIHQKWNLLKRLTSPVDWLILGDSSCAQGVVPATFNVELNQTAIDLCTTGDMGTLGDLWMLEEYIQRLGAPKNVLVVHTYDIWYRDFNPVRLGQIPRPWGFWENHTFGNDLMTENDVLFPTFLEHYAPLYSQNKTIGTTIRNLLAGNLNPFVALWTMGQDGFIPAYTPKPDVVLAGEEQQFQFVSQDTFHVSWINDQALKRIVVMAETYNFNVYIANSPAFEGLFTNENYVAYYQSMQAYLQGVDDQSNNATYISSVKTFPAEEMQNPDHLILSAAEQYTHWLLGEISQSGR